MENRDRVEKEPETEAREEGEKREIERDKDGLDNINLLREIAKFMSFYYGH